MKKLINILIMITLIICTFVGVYNFIYYLTAPEAAAWVGVIFLIFNAAIDIFGIMTILSIKNYKKKRWLGICDLFFLMLIPGLLYLLCWDGVNKELTDSEENQNVRHHRR